MTDTNEVEEVEIPHWAYRGIGACNAILAGSSAILVIIGIIVVNFVCIPHVVRHIIPTTPNWLAVAWWLITVIEVYYGGWLVASSVYSNLRRSILDNEDDGMHWKVVRSTQRTC